MFNSPSTRYVLAGGFTQLAPDGGKAFVEACTNGLTVPIRVLFCGFAKPKEEWEIKRKAAEEQYSKFAQLKLPITMASTENFIEEIKDHDLIYLNGGETPQLYTALCKYSRDPNFWKDTWKGKVVAGNSAGVNVLTAFSYNVDNQKIQSGLGIIQRASLVHFRSPTYNADLHLDWNNIVKELESTTNLSPLYLTEGAFEVIQEN